MKWNDKLIELMEDCLWDLVNTTKMSGNTVQDAIEALHEKQAQIKVNGFETKIDTALNLHFVSNNEADCKYKESCGHEYCNLTECDEYEPKVSEVAVCVIHGCHNILYKRGVCRECYLKLYNTY